MNKNCLNNKIYWANALFTEADRRFNIFVADRLRQKGFNVFLPQEATVNKSKDPTGEEIFRTDTAEIIESDLLIACLDQETIDSGVACEIGLAYSFGIPIIGLYTDIRQQRHGSGQMYKNLYVIGAIESYGEVVRTVDELLKTIPKYINNNSHIERQKQLYEKIITNHYDEVASKYDDYLKKLESWYQPSWNTTKVVKEYVKLLHPKKVFEFGCGTGKLGNFLITQNLDLSYLGYDISCQMIAIAKDKYQNERCMFTSELSTVSAQENFGFFDLSIALFSLNDDLNKESTFSILSQKTRTGGNILLIDLSVHDLPILTERLRYDLARPALSYDPRINPIWIYKEAKKLGLHLLEIKIATLEITFPEPSSLDDYLELFGIYRGMDLPLNLFPDNHQNWKLQIKRLMQSWTFPFIDQRHFIICVLKK